MFNVLPATRSAVPSPDAPNAIFGGNLTSWFDARNGITEVSGLVDNWEDQSGSANDLRAASDPTRPQHLDPDVDGTPSVLYNIGSGKVLRFDVFPSIDANTTMYIFMKLPAADRLRCALWSTSSRGFFVDGHTIGNDRPAIFGGSWWQTTGAEVVGWTLFRFSAADSGDAVALAVNDDAEQTATLTWNVAGLFWHYIGRNASGQQLEGEVKQIVITDTIVADADPEHQKMLDWIKSIYPTLVTY
jgi:hypothetical protein